MARSRSGCGWTRASTSYNASIEYRLTKKLGVYATVMDFNPTHTATGLKQYNVDTPEYANSRTYLTNPTKAVVGVKGEF